MDSTDVFENNFKPDFKLNLTAPSNMKPWMSYVYAQLKFSITTCMVETKGFNYNINLWKCFFNCSPSCRKLNIILKKRKCPSNEQISAIDIIKLSGDSLVPDKARYNAITEQHILNQAQITSEDCKIIPHIWRPHTKVEIVYNFRLDVALRVNVTFIELSLVQGEEEVGLFNGECGMLLTAAGYKRTNCQWVFTFIKHKLSVAKVMFSPFLSFCPQGREDKIEICSESEVFQTCFAL